MNNRIKLAAICFCLVPAMAYAKTPDKLSAFEEVGEQAFGSVGPPYPLPSSTIIPPQNSKFAPLTVQDKTPKPVIITQFELQCAAPARLIYMFKIEGYLDATQALDVDCLVPGAKIPDGFSAFPNGAR